MGFRRGKAMTVVMAASVTVVAAYSLTTFFALLAFVAVGFLVTVSDASIRENGRRGRD